MAGYQGIASIPTAGRYCNESPGKLCENQFKTLLKGIECKQLFGRKIRRIRISFHVQRIVHAFKQLHKL